MFSIYGKSRILAKKTVDKWMLNKNTVVSKELKEAGFNASQAEKQIIIDKHVEQEFIDMKAKRCTHEFSTPDIAKEALTIMLKDTHNFSDLVMMKKANKLNADLKVIKSKATGKPLMQWVPLNQDTKQLAA
jgi:hypothetical protein